MMEDPDNWPARHEIHDVGGVARPLSRADRLWRLWLLVLVTLVITGLLAWRVQLADGLAVTNLSDHVPWGLYIGNFTFAVGLAAGGVLMTIPAYLQRDPHMERVVLVGELVALVAIGVAVAFVCVDLGRPERLWHMLPGLGEFNFPASLFTWDVLALGGYGVINAHILAYSWWSWRRGRRPRPRWRAPFVVVAVIWAIGIHTVTAFLYAGLGARPFWHTALLAPRFIASAFVSGPALLVAILVSGDAASGRLPGARTAVGTLVGVMRVTAIVDLFMLASEVFTALLAGGAEADAVRFLVLGVDGQPSLAPWFWGALIVHVAGVGLLFMRPQVGAKGRLRAACAALFAAIWFEKGLGLLLPGFLPAPMDAVAAYRPSLIEWAVTAGIWAAGALGLSLGLRALRPLLGAREVSVGGHELRRGAKRSVTLREVGAASSGGRDGR